MKRVAPAFVDDLPTLDPVIAHEVTEDGWRALTGDGEVLVVRSANGHQVKVPDGDLLVMRGGVPIGRRLIEQRALSIEDYLTHFQRAVALFCNNECDDALIEIEAAIGQAATARARMNRALILLSLGRWPEGFTEYEQCEQAPPFQRPNSRIAIEQGLKPWRGEDIAGKRLLLLHDHGYGDAIMALRYVPVLRAMGADVTLMMPQPLRRLARQFAPVVTSYPTLPDADYFCSMFLLLHVLKQTPDNIPNASAYIQLEPELVERWHNRLARSTHERIGIAWSVGVHTDYDYPREIPLELLDETLPRDADIFSVQAQGHDEARGVFGINCYPFEDFADCAAFMSHMHQIVSVDTAALHLAGAIGHPRVTGLLSHWHSWRWLANWYPQVKLIRQTTPAYWPSALAQISTFVENLEETSHEQDGR